LENDSLTASVETESDDRERALLEIAIVVALSGVAFAAELAIAERLPWGEEARGVIAVLVGAISAVGLTLRRGGRIADLGFARPTRWRTVPYWVLGILISFIAAQAMAPQIVASFIEIPEPDMSRYDFVRGNLPAAITMMLVLPLTAAIPEEIVYRGFLIGRLNRIFGSGRGSAWLAVLAQSVVFGAVHFQWGLGGVIVTSIMGVVWGGAFLLCGRNLWIVIIAHSVAHIALVKQLYFAPLPL
jgi:membrane protease YdiL (CAAX protease family)